MRLNNLNQLVPFTTTWSGSVQMAETIISQNRVDKHNLFTPEPLSKHAVTTRDMRHEFPGAKLREFLRSHLTKSHKRDRPPVERIRGSCREEAEVEALLGRPTGAETESISKLEPSPSIQMASTSSLRPSNGVTEIQRISDERMELIPRAERLNLIDVLVAVVLPEIASILQCRVIQCLCGSSASAP